MQISGWINIVITLLTFSMFSTWEKIHVSVKNISKFSPFRAVTAWVHKIWKKVWKQTCDRCFFVPCTSSIRFCIAAIIA